MYVPDVHDYSCTEYAAEAKEYFAKGTRETIKKAVAEIIDDEYERFEDHANYAISVLAADRAERFLDRVLQGDDDAAAQLLGSRNGGDRYEVVGPDTGKPWAKIIGGRLFETGGITLRRQIVEAHAELIRNERIADLESVVNGLTQQVRKLKADLKRAYERVREATT